MRENGHDQGRIIRAVGGIALGLVFLAADRGAVTPTTNTQGAFSESASFYPIATENIKITDPLSVQTLKPISTNTPEPIPSPSPTEKPIFTSCSNCLWIPDLPPPDPNYPNLQNPTRINVLDCNQALPDYTKIFSECGGPNHIVILGHAYKALKQLREAYWQGYWTKDVYLAKVVKDVKDVILYYTNGIGQLFAYKLVQVERLTVAGLNELWPLGDTLIQTMTLITCDDAIKLVNGKAVADPDAFRLVAHFERLEYIPSDWQQALAA